MLSTNAVRGVRLPALDAPAVAAAPVLSLAREEVRTMSDARSDDIRAALDGLNYPASKDDVVAHATGKEADDSVVRMLRALPVAIYDNRNDVMAAVPFDQGETAGQSTEERMNERRRHTHSGLAEHEKETPRSPIEEGLGENRGS